MTVFYYDKTFEGLLTAVFDAYRRKEFPDRLLAPGEPEPLFCERVHTVCTDTEKSGRVGRALDKKLPGYVFKMLMCVWLSEEQGADELLFRYMRRVLDTHRSIITDFSDDDIRTVKKLAQKVSHEGHRLMQFVRFQKAADGTYFAPVSPVYNSLPIALEYFTDRFSDQKWLIYDLKRKYGYYYDTCKAVEITLSKDDDLIGGVLSDDMMAEDEKQFRRMWKDYYKALTIKERINPKLQKQFMPVRYWKYMTEHQID